MRIFEHVKLPELDYDMQSVTGEDGKRVYLTPEGNKYTSITTKLSSYNLKGILDWRKRVGEEEANRISKKASTRGTKVHDICEKYLLNEMTDMKFRSMMPDLKETFFKLRKPLDENIGKIYALEQALYSDELKIAGRVDCIAEWNGVLSIIDFKTSKKLKDENNILNYFMQCTAYALMFEERTKKSIDQVVVAIAVDDEEPQIFVRYKTPYIDSLMQYIK
jgi:CRISPR/Cas system-associated exonuclease Cas4 (RecB family)